VICHVIRSGNTTTNNNLRNDSCAIVIAVGRHEASLNAFEQQQQQQQSQKQRQRQRPTICVGSDANNSADAIVQRRAFSCAVNIVSCATRGAIGR